MAPSALPFAGVRVVELASEATAFTGLLFAGQGAEVTVVEPLEGSPTRSFGPFVEDEVGPDRSLWWRFYNRGKDGVRVDLDRPSGRAELVALLRDADVLLESESTAHLAEVGLEWPDASSRFPRLIWVAMTPFGRQEPREDEPVTDLTMLARSGPIWSCGYDDHDLPPVRGGEGHAAHIAGFQAVIGASIALLARLRSGRGQRVDVSLTATGNVTTEMSTYEWLVRRATVQRQTGRHAQVVATQPTQVRARDGRYVNTGVPRATRTECVVLLHWMDELGVRDEFDDVGLLEIGAQGALPVEEPAIRTELIGAQRACISLIARHLDGQVFFVEAQERGLSAGVINAAEDVLTDPQFEARGMWVEVDEPSLGRSLNYPAAPLAFGGVRAVLGPAPSFGGVSFGASEAAETATNPD
ncbi:MAG TPA: CoA transferase [Nocardioidaceae bacterium]